MKPMTAKTEESNSKVRIWIISPPYNNVCGKDHILLQNKKARGRNTIFYVCDFSYPDINRDLKHVLTVNDVEFISTKQLSYTNTWWVNQLDSKPH